MNTSWIIGIAVGAAGLTGGCINRQLVVNDHLSVPIKVLEPACLDAQRRVYGEPHGWGWGLDAASIMQTPNHIIYGIQCEFSNMHDGTHQSPQVDLRRLLDVGVPQIREYLFAHGLLSEQREQLVAAWGERQ